jgi:formamidopyrimidine-DNA glycosylase
VPEGDSIRRLAERIDTRLAGQPVLRCVTRDPRLVGLDLTGTTLLGADAVGKHLLLRFDDGRTVHAHLRMDGSFVVGRRADVAVMRRRLELTFPDGLLTAVDVPILGVVATAAEESVVGHLGPDVCGPEPPDLDDIVARLTHQPSVPLAAALLDQRLVAGFGNVYAVEVPFIAGVSPNQPVDTVSGLVDLVDVAVALIRHTMRGGPRNTTGRRLGAPEHWVYGKRGRPCPLCGTRLDGWTDRDSPWRRVSMWCPRCQPAVADRAVDTARVDRLLALHPARRGFTRPRGGVSGGSAGPRGRTP